MTALRTVTRLAAMDRRELQFRVACEARNAIGRLRFKVRAPAVNRSHLVRILDPSAGPLVRSAIEAARRGDALAAHVALARHFETRVSYWPLQASARQSLTDEIQRDFPQAAAEARTRADKIVAGLHDFLGFTNVVAGNPPDWHADVIHGRRAPLVHWTRVPYLDPAIGDHKIIWETNRHQYFVSLGQAYWLTGDQRYRDTAVAHIEDWIATNPPLAGINWASMLELAFRAISWTWAIEFFSRDAAADGTPWLVDLLLSLDRQLTHIQQNLSTYFSPNTHLSGEGLALYAVSRALPELRRSDRRATLGREILTTEASRQILADGGHAELSSHYHRYSTDFYLFALAIASASGDAATPVFEEAARKQASFLRTIADDRGHLPGIGDDDGGQLFAFGDEPACNASITLGIAATLLGDSALAVSRPRAAESWILGRRPERLKRNHAPVPWPSQVLLDTGYFVSRSRGGSHLVFDAGPHGFLNGGHAHSDALSIVLTVGGVPLLVDPGTGSYTFNAAARDRFRSSQMHNTLVLHGRDHALSRGPFHWQTRADARLLVAQCESSYDFAAGTHAAYAPFQHVRAVLAIHGTGWLIVDRVTGPGEFSADTWWHLHPAWTPDVRGNQIDLSRPDGGCATISMSGGSIAALEHDHGFSPVYGRIERGRAIRASRTARQECVLAAFIPATAEQLRETELIEVPSRSRRADWIETRFQIRLDRWARQLSVWFPADAQTHPHTNWPQPCIEQLETSCVE